MTISHKLNLMKTQSDLDSVISRLEKLEILRENLVKYQKLDKIYCKLDIINLDITIKAQDFKYTN